MIKNGFITVDSTKIKTVLLNKILRMIMSKEEMLELIKEWDLAYEDNKDYSILVSFLEEDRYQIDIVPYRGIGMSIVD